MFTSNKHQSISRRVSKLWVELILGALGVIGIIGILLAQPAVEGACGESSSVNSSQQASANLIVEVDWSEILF